MNLYQFFYDLSGIEAQTVISNFIIDTISELDSIIIRKKYNMENDGFEYKKRIIIDNVNLTIDLISEPQISCVQYILNKQVDDCIISLSFPFVFYKKLSGFSYDSFVEIKISNNLNKKAEEYYFKYKYDEKQDNNIIKVHSNIPSIYECIGKNPIIKEFKIFSNEIIIKDLIERMLSGYIKSDEFYDEFYLKNDLDIKNNLLVNHIMDIILKASLYKKIAFKKQYVL